MAEDAAKDQVLSEVTLLLQNWGQGSDDAYDKLVVAVYDELRAMAGKHFSLEKDGQTLCATALVNEVYLRMAQGDHIVFRDREHFFCVAGRMMRRILVEHARKRLTKKRGSNMRVTFDEQHDAPDTFGVLDMATTIALGDALDLLEKDHPRAAQVLEWRIFAGLNNGEIAQVANMSLATVKREWTLAKQKLFLYMRRGNAGPTK